MNSRVFILLFTLLVFSLQGKTQDLIFEFFDEDWEPTVQDSASYYRKGNQAENGKWLVKDFYMDGQLQMKGHFLSRDLEKEDGHFVYYHQNGQKSREGKFEKGEKVGTWKTWYEEGMLKSRIEYEDGEVGKSVYLNKKGEEKEFVAVEQMPSFPGGQEALFEFLSEHIIYPKVAQDKDIEGRVYVSFVVAKSGEIKGAKVLRSPHPSLSEEALRVVNKMPDWEPGIQRGKRVNVKYNLPIKFTL